MKNLFFCLTLFVAASLNSAFQPKDYSNLLGMPGFSNDALNMHFKLYQGYVKNTNLMLEKLENYLQNNQEKDIAYSEIKRRLGWEYDGMRLHELYFENLGGKDTAIGSDDPLMKAIIKDFGSFDSWKKDFISTGSMRGIGWAVLYYDKVAGKLVNTWINEHDLGHLAGATPILIMDVFEHAYLPDYGLDRAKYIEAFFNNVHWEKAKARYAQSAS